MPKLVGQTIPVKRILTGFHSFDRAFNLEQKPLGLPVGTGVEFYGMTHTGKTTFTWSLLSKISALQGSKGWVLCDLEGYDPERLNLIASTQGMNEDQVIRTCDGTTYKKTSLDTAQDEQLLSELVDYLSSGEYSGGLLDSIAAISPLSEQEGEIGEANFGRRARIMADFSRKYLHVTRSKEAPLLLATNHMYENVGGGKGFTTPGGNVKNYLFTVRVRLSQTKANRYEDGSFVLTGYVDKNRYGGGRDENTFNVVISDGGIHEGLTAVLDSVTYGVAERTTKVKIGDKSFFWKELLENKNDPEIFKPFITALNDFSQEEMK